MRRTAPSVLGLDPGPETSGLVAYDGVRVTPLGNVDNDTGRNILRGWKTRHATVLVVELPVVYQRDSGDLARTCIEAGRTVEAWLAAGGLAVEWLTRSEIKGHLGVRAGGDAAVRAELLARWGGRAVAVGRKASPGPLYGVTGHMWAALAVAVTWIDRR